METSGADFILFGWRPRISDYEVEFRGNKRTALSVQLIRIPNQYPLH